MKIYLDSSSIFTILTGLDSVSDEWYRDIRPVAADRARRPAGLDRVHVRGRGEL